MSDFLKKYFKINILILLSLCLLNQIHLQAAESFKPEDVLRTKNCSQFSLQPQGEWVAYTVSVPRLPGDEPGGAYSELYIISTKTGETRPFIIGKVNVNSPQWSPDGSIIAFLMQRGENAKTQVWSIPVDGGEARPLTQLKNGLSAFHWHPAGKKIAFVATSAKSNREAKLDKKGYGFVFYEENLSTRDLFIIDLAAPEKIDTLIAGKSVWSFEFSPDGNFIAAALSEKNLVDHSYMFQKIHLLDLNTKELRVISNNPGKLGNYAFNADASKLVYTAARELKDHAVSQVNVIDLKTGENRNLTEPNFKGHITTALWRDKQTILYLAHEGVWNTWSLLPATGGKRKVLFHSKDHGVIANAPEFSPDFTHFIFSGSSPEFPAELFSWQPGKPIKQLTNLNPWLKEKNLGRQEVIQYSARDGWKIEGLLIYPVDYQKDQTYPLLVFVHGGPESNHSNDWLTGYATPGQVLSNQGYAVFYPNYRASTGYGVEFALAGYEDPAGKEFDDLADGIDFLVQQKIADRERVGLAGGSYGGFAAA
jgi:dipeptidyl aminopeptidase/acylaminoacyl peptidase